MSLLFLTSGQQVFVDDEDYDAVCGFRWREMRLKPSNRPVVSALVKANKRKFDLLLHRLVAVRMDPEIVKRGFRVEPRDGDYFNCRRENLEIAIRKRLRPGPARRPGGSQHHPGGRIASDVDHLSPDVLLLWNPTKFKIYGQCKKHPGAASRGPGSAGREVGGDPG